MSLTATPLSTEFQRAARSLLGHDLDELPPEKLYGARTICAIIAELLRWNLFLAPQRLLILKAFFSSIEDLLLDLQELEEGDEAPTVLLVVVDCRYVSLTGRSRFYDVEIQDWVDELPELPTTQLSINLSVLLLRVLHAPDPQSESAASPSPVGQGVV